MDLEKNTLIIFTSDNGPWLSYGTHSGSAGNLKEGKGTTWEGGQRVPGLFWGGSIKPGTISDLGSTLDIFPTFLDFAGIDNINDRIIDGNNLSHVFKSLSKSPTENFFYYWGAELMAVRYKSYKLHLKLHEAYDGKPMEVLKKPFLYLTDIIPDLKAERFSVLSLLAYLITSSAGLIILILF